MNRIAVDKLKRCFILIKHLPVEALDDLLQSLEGLTKSYNNTLTTDAQKQLNKTGIGEDKKISAPKKYPPPIVIEPLWRLEDDLR